MGEDEGEITYLTENKANNVSQDLRDELGLVGIHAAHYIHTGHGVLQARLNSSSTVTLFANCCRNETMCVCSHVFGETKVPPLALWLPEKALAQDLF